MNILPPILLHYYITYRCNCRCSFCDIWRDKEAGASPFARPEDVFRNLKEASRLGVRFVDFTGGEPLLHPNLPMFLQQAKSLGLKTSVTTNCILYPEKAGQLAGLVDYLHFSLDAATPEKHDAIRGRKTFDAVMQSLDMARELGEKPDILFTVTRQNIDDLAPMATFARHLKLILIVNPIFSHTSRHEFDISLLLKLESMKHQPYVYINTAFHRLRRQGGNNRNHPRCRVVSSTIVISPDNHVLLPCYHFAQAKIPITQSMAEIRKTDEFRYFLRNQGRFPFCQGCHLNCYFDPSFLYKPDIFLAESLLAKAKYVWDKHMRARLGKSPDQRPAQVILKEILKRERNLLKYYHLVKNSNGRTVNDT